MALRVLTLDYEYAYAPPVTEAARFRSPVSCLDFDVVIWDPAETLMSYTSTGEYNGLPSLSQAESTRILADIARRRQEFQEILELGRTLVAIVRPPQRFYFDTGEREYSGTGRSRHTTIKVSGSDLWQALPFELELHPASGRQLACTAGGPLSDLWARQKQFFAYEAYMRRTVGTPYWHIVGTKRVEGPVDPLSWQ